MLFVQGLLQEQLNSAMSNLMTDNDRDVAHAARSLHATFKRTPLRMTGGAGLLDINGTSSGPGRLSHHRFCFWHALAWLPWCAALLSMHP